MRFRFKKSPRTSRATLRPSTDTSNKENRKTVAVTDPSKGGNALKSKPKKRRAWPIPIIGAAVHITGSLVFELLGFTFGFLSGVVVASVILGKNRTLTVEKPEVKRIVDIKDDDELVRILRQVPEWVKSPNLERVSWLNSVISKAWKHIDVVWTDIFNEHIWPIIKEKLLELGITMKIRSMTMGDFPPIFDYVKALDTVDDECIIETMVKFATNASALCELRSCGVETVLHLSELQGSAVIRFTFAPLTNSFPCFAGVNISLMNPPDIDASLTASGGIDVLCIPRIKGMVLEVIQGTLADMLLWPRRFLLALQHEALAGEKHAVGTITLHILHARGLIYQGLGSPSPYLKISMDESRQARTATRSGVNPVWHEKLMLAVGDPAKDIIRLSVMDYDAVFRDSILGTAYIAVNSLQPGVAKKLTLELQSKRGLLHRTREPGVIDLEATLRLFKPSQSEEGNAITGSTNSFNHSNSAGVLASSQSTVLQNHSQSIVEARSFETVLDSSVALASGLLQVFVRKAINLELHNYGNLTTYCKIFVNGDIRKTRVVRQMNNPEWNEDFEFVLETTPINSKLRVEVWHFEDTLSILSSSKRLLGVLEVNLKDVVENQRIVDVFALNQAKQGQLKLELTWFKH